MLVFGMIITMAVAEEAATTNISAARLSTIHGLSGELLGPSFLKNNYSLLVGCVYCPPNASGDYDLCLSQAFHATADLNLKYCLIAGDFNLSEVQWFPPSGPPKFENLLEAVDIAMLVQVFDFPTRGSNILDLILRGGYETLSVSSLDKLGTSDHLTVVTKPEPEADEIFSQNYSFSHDIRSAELLTHFNSLDWSDVFQSSNVNVCTDTLISRFVPFKKIIHAKDEMHITLSFRRRLTRLSRRLHQQKDTFILPLIHLIFEQAKTFSKEKQIADEVKFAENPTLKVVKLFSRTVKAQRKAQHPILQDTLGNHTVDAKLKASMRCNPEL
ncbi:unnamed protein product [Dibothriocephalus latus]|uniref:Endonuclease/exonuclease/phosphatase domain-containing protein n=1 Tax=Dibothriocephalus latus TaxID=60516 RepID=A0A3P7LQD3_DIBLA|nr:unnamed protein product [Dibothriocephalus latus]